MHFSEKLLYHIWDAQHLSEGLNSISGKEIKVLYPGRWNTDAGPDFKDAIIDINGNIIRGDVELELETYNWNLHDHHENPAFNNVIIHVVYRHNGKYDFTITEDGSQIEILELINNLDSNISKLFSKYNLNANKGESRECPFFKAIESNNLPIYLKKLGLDRFENKINRFQVEHYFEDFDQLIWQGLLEALGYSKNKYQMLQLALNIKFAKLKEIYVENRLHVHDVIALLLGSSDLLNKLPNSIPSEFKLKWQELLANQEYGIKPIKIDWNLFRIRPVNHPAMRILQIAGIIYESLDSSLFQNILKLFSVSENKFNLQIIRSNIYSYFQTTVEFLPENMKMGKTQIDIILINIILPLLILYAKEKQYASLLKVV